MVRLWTTEVELLALGVPVELICRRTTTTRLLWVILEAYTRELAASTVLPVPVTAPRFRLPVELLERIRRLLLRMPPTMFRLAVPLTEMVVPLAVMTGALMVWEAPPATVMLAVPLLSKVRVLVVPGKPRVYPWVAVFRMMPPTIWLPLRATVPGVPMTVSSNVATWLMPQGMPLAQLLLAPVLVVHLPSPV